MKKNISRELRRYNYLFGETMAAYHEMYLKLGMSDSAITILYAVLENGGKRPLQEVRHYTGLSKQTANSALRTLEKEDILYLEMTGSKNKTVCLTEKGKLLAEKTAGRVLAAENEIFASWTQEDADKYLELTETFLLALKEKTRNL